MKWGLIPSFAEDMKRWTGRTFNCRKDSLLEGRSIWVPPRKHKRCLVFAEGYYEWMNQGKNKVPYFIKRKDGNLICFAGLWEKNTKVDEKGTKHSDDNPLYSFTIVTTDAHKGMEWLHSRMPLIVDPTDKFVEKWLDPSYEWGAHEKDLASFIKSYDPDKLEIYEVSTDVNRIGQDSPNMTKPVKKHDFFTKRKKGDTKDEEQDEKAPEPKKPKQDTKDRKIKVENKEPEDQDDEKKSRKSGKSSESDKPSTVKEEAADDEEAEDMPEEEAEDEPVTSTPESGESEEADEGFAEDDSGEAEEEDTTKGRKPSGGNKFAGRDKAAKGDSISERAHTSPRAARRK